MAYAPRLHTLPADRPRLTRLFCFLTGCLTTLAFAPFELSLLAPILLVPLLFVATVTAPRETGGHAFWYGFGLFVTGTYWIYISVVVFGEAPAWIAVLLALGLSLIMAFWLFMCGWMISRLAQSEPMRIVAIAPAAWVLIEWLRGWVLSGFPWLAFGYANVDSLYSGWAPVAGVYGVSFAVVLSAAALLAALSVRGRQRHIALAVILTPWLLGGSFGLVDWTEEDGEPLRVSILQSGIPQDQKWLPENRIPTLQYYRDNTIAHGDSDIIVWPEVAVPSLTSLESNYISQLQADAREGGYNILFGILEDQNDRGERRIYNSVVNLNGGQWQVYRKRHLVPFGEYFPVPDKVREWMRMMSLPHNDLRAGADVQALLDTRGGSRMAVMICYEDAYGAEQRYALPDAGLFVNVSNDAWFGDSIAPHQHLQIASMRSLEYGRPTVRSTNTGISAFIDHLGRVLKQGPQFRETTLSASVQPRRGSTPYASFGNAPVLSVCLLILGFFWLRART